MVVISKVLMKAALLITASFSLSGCVYDVGLGFASDGYNDDGYGCDPYGGYDSYYDCDYGQGFGDIGFSGGYFDNYFYPGYGFFLFDNVGRRYPMRDHHRRYWGEKRHGWYREHRGNRHDGRRLDGRERQYTDSVTLGTTDWPSGRGDSARNSANARPDGHGSRDDSRRGRDTRGAGDAPAPNPYVMPRSAPGRGSVDGLGGHDRHRDVTPSVPPALQPPVQLDVDALRNAPTSRTAPRSRPERPDPTSRRGRNEWENIRDQ